MRPSGETDIDPILDEDYYGRMVEMLEALLDETGGDCLSSGSGTLCQG
jgi:hypothetical protein